ncbi:MAG: hypothetical protein WA628_08260 [Terriglobales bacterium]
MADIPLTQKLRILTRVAGRQAGHSRTLGAVLQAGRVTLRSFARVLHQLWLEVTGFVFLAMAGIGGIALAREYAQYQAGKTGLGRVAIAVCFCLTFGYFGLNSFWRVRRKRPN